MTLTTWEGWLIKEVQPICLVYGTHHYITGAVKKNVGTLLSPHTACLSRRLSPRHFTSFPMSQVWCCSAESLNPTLLKVHRVPPRWKRFKYTSVPHYSAWLGENYCQCCRSHSIKQMWLFKAAEHSWWWNAGDLNGTGTAIPTGSVMKVSICKAMPIKERVLQRLRAPKWEGRWLSSAGFIQWWIR